MRWCWWWNDVLMHEKKICKRIKVWMWEKYEPHKDWLGAVNSYFLPCNNEISIAIVIWILYFCLFFFCEYVSVFKPISTMVTYRALLIPYFRKQQKKHNFSFRFYTLISRTLIYIFLQWSVQCAQGNENQNGKRVRKLSLWHTKKKKNNNKIWWNYHKSNRYRNEMEIWLKAEMKMRVGEKRKIKNKKINECIRFTRNTQQNISHHFCVSHTALLLHFPSFFYLCLSFFFFVCLNFIFGFYHYDLFIFC